jgi:hypothetical protein
MLAVHRRRDAAENAECTVPEDQEIRIEAIWVAEIYPPTVAPRLVQDLINMRWEEDPSRSNRPGVSTFLAEQRSQWGGSWLNLGLVLRPADRRFLGSHRRADLPQGVDHASAEILSPAASFSILVVQFNLDNEASLRIDGALRREYQTEMRPAGVALSILTPRSRKEEAARQARAVMRDGCRAWMQDHLSGRFSVDGGGLKHPTVELLTTAAGLVVGEVPTGRFSVAALLGVSADYDKWHCDEGVALRLSLGERDTRRELLVNANRQEAVAVARERGYADAPSLFSHALARLAAVWSISVMLEGYIDRLAQARYTLLAPRRGLQSRSPVKALRDLNDVVLSLSSDVRLVTSDIAHLAEDPVFLIDEVPKLIPMNERFNGKDPFAQTLVSGCAAAASRLRAAEEELRDLLVTAATTKGAIANIQLQRGVFWWTVILGVFTAALLGLGVINLLMATHVLK